MICSRLFDGWGDFVISVGLNLDDSIRILIEFYDTIRIDKKYSFVNIGSYRFCNFQKIAKQPNDSFGAGVSYVTRTVQRTDHMTSEHFYVLGKRGDDFQMTLYGTFDVVLGDDWSGRTQVIGEYNMTFTDYYF